MYHGTRHHLRLTTVRQAGREARSWHMTAAEGLVAVGRVIMAYRRGDGAATNCVDTWVTVALQHLRSGTMSRPG